MVLSPQRVTMPTNALYMILGLGRLNRERMCTAAWGQGTNQRCALSETVETR